MKRHNLIQQHTPELNALAHLDKEIVERAELARAARPFGFACHCGFLQSSNSRLRQRASAKSSALQPCAHLLHRAKLPVSVGVCNA
jgi:hypothetical protein